MKTNNFKWYIVRYLAINLHQEDPNKLAGKAVTGRSIPRLSTCLRRGITVDEKPGGNDQPKSDHPLLPLIYM